MNKENFSTDQIFKRLFIYIIGLIILSLGITLNTKTGLGVSPIVSIAFCVSNISGLSFSVLTFALYCVFVLLQFILLGKNFQIFQVLQVVVSFLTSFFIDIFDRMIPVADTLWLRIVLLIAAILCVGIGAALSVGMKLIPNPADGLANVIGIKIKKSFGFGKNLFDFSCIFIALVIGLVFAGKIIGIGVGTICCMLFIGRVIAIFSPWIAKLYTSNR